MPIWRARSLARADRVPEAIAAFEVLARKPGPNQADARFFAASLLEGRGREEEARVHLVWLADDPRQGELSRTALWKLGWADYRNRRFGDAVGRFEDLASATTDPIARLKPDYWRARALAQLDRQDEAARAFESLARELSALVLRLAVEAPGLGGRASRPSRARWPLGTESPDAERARRGSESWSTPVCTRRAQPRRVAWSGWRAVSRTGSAWRDS